MTCPTCNNEFTTTRSLNSPPPKFCSLRCKGVAKRGVKNPGVSRALRKRVGPKHYRWKGGRCVDDKGYVRIRTSPEYWQISGKRYIREHRLVMEKALGRTLKPREIVHHKNGDRADNRLENLELTDHSRHITEHHLDGPQFQPLNRWSRSYDACVLCDTSTKRYGGRGMCCACYTAWFRRKSCIKPGCNNRARIAGFCLRHV